MTILLQDSFSLRIVPNNIEYSLFYILGYKNCNVNYSIKKLQIFYPSKTVSYTMLIFLNPLNNSIQRILCICVYFGSSLRALYSLTESKQIQISLVLACLGYHNKLTQLNRNLFLIVLETGSPGSRYGHTLFSVGALFLPGDQHHLGPCWDGLSQLPVWKRESSLESLFIRTLILSDQGPTLMASITLHCLLRGLISKYSHTGGLKLQYMNLGG